MELVADLVKRELTLAQAIDGWEFTHAHKVSIMTTLNHRTDKKLKCSGFFHLSPIPVALCDTDTKNLFEKAHLPRPSDETVEMTQPVSIFSQV